MTDREKLNELIRKSIEEFNKMNPTQQAALIKSQGESWAHAEASWPKPKFKTLPDGTRVYESYEDYCNS